MLHADCLGEQEGDEGIVIIGCDKLNEYYSLTMKTMRAILAVRLKEALDHAKDH